jgi:hypothetical protein
MDMIALKRIATRGLRKCCIALLMLSVALAVLPVQPVQAATNYIDEFTIPPFPGFVPAFTTGSQSTGLAYSCTNCAFNIYSGAIRANSWTGAGSFTVAARDGAAFDFNSIWVNASYALTISGSGPEPFSFFVPAIPGTVGPPEPKRVNQVVVAPAFGVLDFDVVFDDVNVVLYEPEIDVHYHSVLYIPDGGTHNIGLRRESLVGLTYTIKNDGDDNLTIGVPTGTNMANTSNFDMLYHESLVPPDETTVVWFRFNIDLDGPFSLDLGIPNNDADENPYVIHIQGVLDSDPPGITSFERHTPATSPTNADVLVFRATFDEDVQNVCCADFAVTGTTALVWEVTSSSDSVYDVTVLYGDLAGLNGTVGLDLAGGQNITDLAGNALPGGDPDTDETYTVDNDAPGITSFTRQAPTDSPTNTDELVFRATFDEDVQNVSNADFAVTGTTATVTAVTSSSANVYDVTVSGGDLAGLNGTVGLDLAGGQNITDPVGNALPIGEPPIDETYLVDNDAPGITSFTRLTPDTSPTNADALVFRATFDEGVENVDAADFTVSGTSATVTNVYPNPSDPTVYDVTVSGGNLAGLSGIVGLDLAGGQNITDPAGNALPMVEPGTDETYTLDNDAPGITSFTRHDPATSPTSADVLVFRASFDEAVQNVDAADFTVTGTTATVTAVTSSSASDYDVTISGGDLAGLNGTVGLNLAGGQDISDPAGNALPAGEPDTDQTYMVDNAAPVPTIDQAGGQLDPATTQPINFAVDFGEAVKDLMRPISP